jgi:alanine racemase
VSRRPTVARIDLDALGHNVRALAAFLSPPEGAGKWGRHPASPGRRPHGPGIMAVVKANAYGHGAARVALAIEAAGAPMLACADIAEGVLLREAGVGVPILIFGALSIGDVDGIFEQALTPTVSTPSAARSLEAAAARRRVRLSCHLKVDTGMNRLGFRHDQLAASPHLAIDGLYTHFATADVPDDPLFALQRERFARARRTLATLGIAPGVIHAANSAALLRDERVWFDYVRPGLLLYGLVPPPLASTLPLRPVMSLTSRIVAVKGIRPGEGVSYGMRYHTDVPRRIAVVPAGYADGVDTRLGNRGVVLVRGRRVPVVGAVCMDMMMVDVTDLDVAPGDDVVIVGEQGGERLDVREVAATIGAIPWELLCRVGSRIERIYEVDG